MPSQAPQTPRTTRNSRGLRRSSTSPTFGDSSRVSRRRRASPLSPSHLLAVAEEQLLPAAPAPTPAAAALSAAAAAYPPIFPPPVALPPATPQLFSPPALEHQRVSSLRRSARRLASPRTPVRYPRYHTRFVDATPSTSPVPTPESPGDETRLFRQRRSQEGAETFARELWIAIRNDQFMRGCWCGQPNIYISKEEAEAAKGHLRFYVVGKTLRVLQRKDDFGWHCRCGNDDQHAVYKALINENGKRPAEDTEIDLIAPHNNEKGDQIFDRVVWTPTDQINKELEQSQALQDRQEERPAPAQSMWAQAVGLFSRAVATMGSPLATLYGKLREQFRGDAYDTIDIRKKDATNGGIVVKRLKRQAQTSPTAQSTEDNEHDGFDDLVWADDPTKRIGFERIEHLANVFATQLDSIREGNIVGGLCVADIQMQIEDGQDLGASIAIHKYQELKYGPTSPEESEDERADKLLKVLGLYQDRLVMSIRFMQNVYDYDLFHELKKSHPTPPRRFPLGGTMFRQNSMMVGDFLGFVLSLDDECKIDAATYETICHMIVDANAIHKQEMVPSFVKLKDNPTEDMPGFFPEDKVSAMEEVPADELGIQPLYDFKFPEPEPSNQEEHIEPGYYRLVPEPKGILKPSKEWDMPTSPHYVMTPEKKRKLAFVNPVSKFMLPAHIPARIMTPREADQIVKAKLKADVLRDEHSVRMFEASRTVPRQENLKLSIWDNWNLEALEKDDREMGLAYHAQKYGGFLTDLRGDLEKRAEGKEDSRVRPSAQPAPQRRMVQRPLPRPPSTPHPRFQTSHLLDGDTSSPAESTPGVNPLMQPKAAAQSPTPAKKKPEPRGLEEFFAADEDDDLPISILKLEELQLDRQIREEHEAGLKRSAEEERKRKEEEELREKQRRIEEERRRQEAERRRKEEEQRREQEARRRREADEFAALTGLKHPTRPLITTLPGDWELKVNNAARANPAAELVKTLEGQPLTRRDFEEKLLPPTAWLNDNIIIGSILHVADYINRAQGATDQEPKCAAFTSYFWPRLLSHGPSGCGRLLRRAGVRKANFFNIDTILIPICAQSHWTLAVIRPGKKTVSHLDSMRAGRGHDDVKTKLLELVRFILEDQFVEADWRAVNYEAPRQTNGWDCGVFTITNAMCMALSLNPKDAYTERELTLQRRRLAAMLLNEGFKGEFSLDGF